MAWMVVAGVVIVIGWFSWQHRNAIPTITLPGTIVGQNLYYSKGGTGQKLTLQLPGSDWYFIDVSVNNMAQDMSQVMGQTYTVDLAGNSGIIAATISSGTPSPMAPTPTHLVYYGAVMNAKVVAAMKKKEAEMGRWRG